MATNEELNAAKETAKALAEQSESNFDVAYALYVADGPGPGCRRHGDGAV
ncbi:MAG: hypothetical protein M0Z36_05370 [Thermaerobacter sp.]|nr:hypothetical protein [Thermaerobacter sp.]